MHEGIENIYIYMCLEKLIFFNDYCANMVYEFKSLYACVNNAKIYLIGLIIFIDA